MATKPLPAHGTYARANGCPGYREPCKCEPCLNARRAGKKRQRVNRQLGRIPYRDASRARARLRELNQTMGWVAIAAAVDSSPAHMRQIASGRIPKIKHATHAKIMAVKPEPSGGQYIDATGSVRHCRALQALGHTAETIATAAGSARSRIVIVISGQQRIRRSLAMKIEVAYRALAEKEGTSTRSRNRAHREGWAPPGAWDDDTIDDPNAHPEWTGHCGTDRGWWLHSINDIPVCPPCETAHQQWKAERAHLSHKERWAELGRARAAASNRGATIAADARELLSYGVPVEQAAARLGVTRNHLQQELLRHPEDMEVAA
ncbi:hypothetical protein [Streptomyces bullii]|uniref:Helix-turn-helix DNA binding domain protein n=1 Tax=Streptomyces bullii TaxID=349910 RepID=A0ABW0UPY6_9ACTN